jgi:regulatory protein
VLVRLRQTGLVDDAAFARYWVENRDAFSPRGSRALRAELRLKGVGDEEVRGVLEDGRDEAAGAHAAGERKARQLKGLDRRTFRQRLGAFLARRGFSYDAISQVTDRLYAEVGGGDSSGDNEGESESDV